MTTFTVTTAADVVNAGDGVLSLREAVQQANATEAADDIRFAVGLEGQTLTLTQGQLTLADADPTGSSGRTTIDGDANNDGSRVTISAGGQSRVLEIQDGAYVGLAGLTFANGDVDNGSGGGILVGEQCNVNYYLESSRNCAAGEYDTSNSYAMHHGGGLAVSSNSTVSVESSQINSNFSNSGGGISVADQAFLSINSSLLHAQLGWTIQRFFKWPYRRRRRLKILGLSISTIRRSQTMKPVLAAGLWAGTFRLENSTIAR